MSANFPTAQREAGHVPADLIPLGVDPRQVIVIQERAPRSYKGPAVLVLVSSLGAALVVWLLVLLVQTTADSADDLAKIAGAVGGIGVGGVTLRLTKGGGKR